LFSAPIEALLSACARTGADDHAAAENAFAAALAHLPTLRPLLRLQPPATCGLDAVAEALRQFATAPAAWQRVVLAACASAVNADRVVTEDEAELIRAIADALDCPLPPLLAAPEV
jgi:hypothetical protein